MAEPGGDAILLDTHVWIWVVEGETEQLSDAGIEEIEQGSREGRILVSAISVWEVAMLEAKRRLTLSRPIDEWVCSALRAPGVQLLGLSPEIAIESTRLPGSPGGDPADRILIAGARVAGARLATRDPGILGYAGQGHVAALDANP